MPVRGTSPSSTQHRSSPDGAPQLVRAHKADVRAQPAGLTVPPVLLSLLSSCPPQHQPPRRPPRPLELLLSYLPPLFRRSDSEEHFYSVACCLSDFVMSILFLTMETTSKLLMSLLHLQHEWTVCQTREAGSCCAGQPRDQGGESSAGLTFSSVLLIPPFSSPLSSTSCSCTSTSRSKWPQPRSTWALFSQ